MRLHRFYVLQPLGEDVVINNVSTIKQWKNVFRYKKGDFVILFNGDGIDSTYSVETISKDECTLTRTKQTPSYIPTKKVTIYLSLIKKDSFELAIQKLTEVGVSTIIPILSKHSIKKELSDSRLQKIAIEATEQCGRGDVPTILPIISLSDVFETNVPHDVNYVLDLNGISFKDIEKSISTAMSIGLFIGPEGGWSDEDEEMFKKNNVKSLTLGKSILRAETAAIIASAFALQ